MTIARDDLKDCGWYVGLIGGDYPGVAMWDGEIFHTYQRSLSQYDEWYVRDVCYKWSDTPIAGFSFMPLKEIDIKVELPQPELPPPLSEERRRILEDKYREMIAERKRMERILCRNCAEKSEILCEKWDLSRDDVLNSDKERICYFCGGTKYRPKMKRIKFDKGEIIPEIKDLAATAVMKART